MTNTTQQQDNPITVEVISLTQYFNDTFNKERFLEFHKGAVERSMGNLKLVTPNDLAQANYAVIATDEAGQTRGQCLLFNANSGADKVTLYQGHLKEPATNSLILTSLSGRRAIPSILQKVQSSTMLAQFALCAKTNAQNTTAKELFEAAGFDSQGLTIGSGEESYFYHGKNNSSVEKQNSHSSALVFTPQTSYPNLTSKGI